MVLNSRDKLMILKTLTPALTPSLSAKFTYPLAYGLFMSAYLTGISRIRAILNNILHSHAHPQRVFPTRFPQMTSVSSHLLAKPKELLSISCFPQPHSSDFREVL